MNRKRRNLSAKALEARRKNAKKSTGPKTERGKSASSGNSFKHGLSSASYYLPADQAQIERFSELIASDKSFFIGTAPVEATPLVEEKKTDSMTLVAAMQIAQAQFDLERVRLTRVSILKQHLAAINGNNDETPKSPKTPKLADLLCSTDRYERQALARRRRALKALEDLD